MTEQINVVVHNRSGCKVTVDRTTEGVDIIIHEVTMMTADANENPVKCGAQSPGVKDCSTSGPVTDATVSDLLSGTLSVNNARASVGLPENIPCIYAGVNFDKPLMQESAQPCDSHATMTKDEERALREENAKLRDVLHRAREAMVLLAALAGSRADDGIPFAQIDEDARALGA